MKPFTQGFDPSCTTPNGPRMAVVIRPNPENSTTIPRQKSTAWKTLSRRVPCRFRKNDMVMGIMGKTQGVKMAARPKPKATSRNAPRPWVSGRGRPGGRPRTWGSAPLTSVYPAGMAEAAARAAGSMVRVALAVRRRGGMHTVSLQVW
jgi:hypothetical protein